MANTLAYFDQMQGETYSTLSSTNFKLGIVDPDDTQLTSSQVSSLTSSGKTVVGYLSIGEAEDYRSYWQSSWNTSKPSFLLGENPDWPGNYNVKYWDPAWQKIIIDRATTLAKAGYSGLMLDVVDAYTVSAVASADGGIDHARADMVKFVTAIADATKAINPDFKIIQNNALDLLTTNPDDPSSSTNTSYLSHIDGVVAESTYYNPNNTATSWGAWNIQYLEHAVDAGKTVLTIDYPTNSTTQQNFINKAIADGFIPFVGTQALNSIPSINYQIPGSLGATAMASLTGSSGSTGTTTPPPTTTANTIYGTPTVNAINGTSGDDTIYAGSGTHTIHASAGNDSIYGGANKNIMDGGAGNDHLYSGSANSRFEFNKGYGNDTIHNYMHGDNMIDVSHLIYSNRSQVLSHVTYSGNDAVIHLDGTNTVTVLGVGAHSLTVNDFHIT